MELAVLPVEDEDLGRHQGGGHCFRVEAHDGFGNTSYIAVHVFVGEMKGVIVIKESSAHVH